MEESTIEAVFILFVAVFPCGIFGYLIAFKERRGLISGFNDKSFSNPKAFGKNVGISLILFSISLAFIAYLWHLGDVTENQMSFYVIFLITAVVLNYIYGMIKYRKKSN
ncbi:hypothetical protein [Cognaticolwellia mytili]|uniref:hypothetical protein n=1 Tax=Cognaticolwellia mytili TaxID=1888913 RepID=UPI000A176EE4|nr:hypothetical protein [Cognaticolwellia mytili]